MSNIFDAVKEAVTVPMAAERYGLQANRAGMARCPFHDDHTPSLKLNERYFYCFGCGEHGSVVDFVVKLFNLRPYDAALRKFFPAMGRFLTETKKYDKAIRSLKADNEELQTELKDAKAESYHKLLADAQLRADYENLQRVMDKIPPEIVFLYAGQDRNRDKCHETER